MGKTGPYHWAILGTGAIAHEMAQAFRHAGRTPYAVGNRTRAKAEEFAKQYGVSKVYGDFHEMFTDDDVDIIYLATPHNTHSEYLIEALRNGKHVLCEKAITLNSRELEKAAAAADENHLVLAEAMTIYHMPLYHQLGKVISSGKLGGVRMIQASFGSYKDYDMTNRFFNKDLAGGALLDIGVYAISLARFFMGCKPDQVSSQVRFAPSGADEQSGILMMNPKGEMAVISLTLHAKQPKRAVISCEKGYIEIMGYPRADEAVIVYTESGARETLKAGEQCRALQYEIENMERAVLGQENDMRLEFTRDVMEIMTEIRRNWGMYYASEIPDNEIRQSEK